MTKEQSKEMWSSIEKLSELRSNYSCFNEEEEPFYRALSLGIKGIKTLEQNTVSEEVYTAEHFARKEAEQKLYELQQNISDDCVSRADVKDKAIQLWNGSGDEDYKFNTLVDYINDLPPVTPTHKVGKWIYKKLGVRTFGIVCSNCNRVYHEGQNVGSLEEFKKDIERIMHERNVTLDEYCCHCGAEMRGSENEHTNC